MKFFKYKTIILGDFRAKQYTIFENKKYFSVILYYFKGKGWKDRYHTHAFNAISIKIFGTYSERILLDKTTEKYNQTLRKNIFKYFPKSSYHMLGCSKGCLTFLFAGPWESTWKEFKNGKEIELKWGRKK